MINNLFSGKNQTYLLFVIVILATLTILTIIFFKNKQPASNDLNLRNSSSSENSQSKSDQSQTNKETSLTTDSSLEPSSNSSLSSPNHQLELSSDINSKINSENTQKSTITQPSSAPMKKTQMPKPSFLIDKSQPYFAYLDTNYGQIKIKLFADVTPIAVNNFVYLAEAGFYNELTFHRIINDFMIQGGCPIGNGTGNPGYQFADEANSNPLVKGSLARANSGPNTNGSQFFIVTAEFTPWLDGKHTHFGQVVLGMDVVEKIENVETDGSDRPLKPVVINQVTIQHH